VTVSELLAVGVVEPSYVLSESEAALELGQAYSVSVQLAVVKALRYYYLVHHEGARPRDLLLFLKRCGVEVKDNVLRSALSKLVRKGVVLRRGRRYYPRMDLKPETAVMVRRRIHGDSKKRNKSKEYMYARPKDELRDFGMKIVERIEKLVKDYDKIKALGYILFFGCGLRPSSDRVLGIGIDSQGSIYALVYEGKLERLRLVTNEEGFMWMLMSHQLIYDFVRSIIESAGDNESVVFDLDGFSIVSDILEKHLWKILGRKITWLWFDENEWSLLSSLVKFKRLARSVFLSYVDEFEAQLKVLGEINYIQVVQGMHANTGVRKYYVRE